MKFKYDAEINDVLGISSKNDKIILKNALLELKNKDKSFFLNNYNKNIIIDVSTCLLDSEEVFNSIANDLNFIKIEFLPSNFFTFQEFKVLLEEKENKFCL